MPRLSSEIVKLFAYDMFREVTDVILSRGPESLLSYFPFS